MRHKSLQKPIKTKTKGFLVNPTYADDITIAGTNKQQIDELEEKIPQKLEEYNLTVNADKTEKYEIPRPPAPPPPPATMEVLLKHKNDRILWSDLDWLTNYTPPPIENKEPDWRKCKLLGSLLGTEEDIQRRKILTIDSMTSYEDLYKSKRISIPLKVRTFLAYSASVFLYNSELWALSETLEKQIDAFQRKLLRRVINIRWPKIITNEKLYELTGIIEWSKIIRKRRLKWIGHVMRLNENTPVRLALKESITGIRRKVGRPKITWIKVIKKDLALIDIDLDINLDETSIEIELIELTRDRCQWKNLIKNIMAVNC